MQSTYGVFPYFTNIPVAFHSNIFFYSELDVSGCPAMELADCVYADKLNSGWRRFKENSKLR